MSKPQWDEGVGVPTGTAVGGGGGMVLNERTGSAQLRRMVPSLYTTPALYHLLHSLRHAGSARGVPSSGPVWMGPFGVPCPWPERLNAPGPTGPVRLSVVSHRGLQHQTPGFTRNADTVKRGG